MLLTGLYQPHRERFLLDGQPGCRRAAVEDYRKLAAVFTDVEDRPPAGAAGENRATWRWSKWLEHLKMRRTS